MKLNFYNVDENYIKYLQQFDKQIPVLDYENRRKFVCGVVLQKNDKKFFVPVSSNKKQQKTNFCIRDMRNSKSILGSLRLSFMFPVINEVLSLKEISQEQDVKYKKLLEKEYQFISNDNNSNKIMEKAEAVYQIGCDKDNPYNKYCCDFKKLENVATLEEYNKYLIENHLPPIANSAFNQQSQPAVANKQSQALQAMRAGVPKKGLNKGLAQGNKNGFSMG